MLAKLKQPLVTRATIRCADPSALAKALADQWISFDVAVAFDGGRLRAPLGAGESEFWVEGPTLKARLEAPELGALEVLRGYLTENLAGLAGEGAEIEWRGNMRRAATFADFRQVRLVASRLVAPRVRRLTFTGEGVERFGSDTDIHVRMYFPPDGADRPEWPRPGPDGRTVWPVEERRPDVRYYTVRRFDADRSEIEIDFVMHDNEGPGSSFAAHAAPGAVCGMAGPLGRTAPSADWTLLAGDETALPAIARILESMPADAKGACLIEVDAAEDEMALRAPAGVSVRWLHRKGASTGEVDLLAAAVAAVPMPDGEDVFAWVACEYSASKAIREHLRTQRQLPRERCLVVGYWQRAAA
ncbi:siderophore-interacting protein [Methylopila sp. M107]|uniref:siderophore-interacting protein n=1 Tax=Methylopila sp. M107 TaxID=1101190 RepID=UPI00037B5E7A|nr:siderophore-interacting protein [Methylopila sp. M107]